MERCKKYQDMFGEADLNELSGEDAAAFDSHLDACETCRSAFVQYQETVAFMKQRELPNVRDGYWDAYWDKLSAMNPEENDKPEKIVRRAKIFYSNYRAGFLSAAALLLILFGLYLGKMLYSPDQSGLIRENRPSFATATDRGLSTGAQNAVYTLVNDHFGSLRPIFAEYANASEEDWKAGGSIEVQKEILQRLIMQNYLIKRRIQLIKDPQLRELIRDMELILLELINNSQKTERIENVRYMLKGNDLLFKMDLMKKRLVKNEKKGVTL